jgi:hypothetical protein
MNSPEIKEFIKKNSVLFWNIPENRKQDISKEILVEAVLIYGDWDSVLELIHLIGMKETAGIFFYTTGLSDRRKANYPELVRNYFTVFFQRHS